MHLTKAYIICISWRDIRVNTTYREMVLFKFLYMNSFLKGWLTVCLSVNELRLSESRHGKCRLYGPKGQVRSTSLGNYSELPWSIPRNSVESGLGCTSRIYFDNVTLTFLTWRWRHRNHANTITSVIAAKQTVINEVYVVVFFFNKISLQTSFILLIKLFG